MSKMNFNTIENFSNYTSYLRIKNIKNNQNNPTNKKNTQERLNQINGFKCCPCSKSNCCSYSLTGGKPDISYNASTYTLNKKCLCLKSKMVVENLYIRHNPFPKSSHIIGYSEINDMEFGSLALSKCDRDISIQSILFNIDETPIISLAITFSGDIWGGVDINCIIVSNKFNTLKLYLNKATIKYWDTVNGDTSKSDGKYISYTWYIIRTASVNDDLLNEWVIQVGR